MKTREPRQPRPPGATMGTSAAASYGDSAHGASPSPTPFDNGRESPENEFLDAGPWGGGGAPIPSRPKQASMSKIERYRELHFCGVLFFLSVSDLCCFLSLFFFSFLSWVSSSCWIWLCFSTWPIFGRDFSFVFFHHFLITFFFFFYNFFQLYFLNFFKFFFHFL